MADEEEDIVFQFVSRKKEIREFEISEYMERDEKREISSVKEWQKVTGERSMPFNVILWREQYKDEKFTKFV